MKAQKLTFATLLVIVIGVIVVALLVMGMWAGYKSIAAKYGLTPPTGPNFGNLVLPPYVVEVASISSIDYDKCVDLVNGGTIDKGNFATAEDYCNYYCPFGCYKVTVVVYSYLYNKEQNVSVDLYADTNMGWYYFDTHKVHLEPWNGNTENGKSTTKATTIFLLPRYPNDCELNALIFNATNGEYVNKTIKNYDGECVLCGCMFDLSCKDIRCCPYLANFTEDGEVITLDSVVCQSDGNCTTCEAYCANHSFLHGECLEIAGNIRCTPTEQESYLSPSQWKNCTCYDYLTCSEIGGECKSSCGEGEVGFAAKDCLLNGEVCCKPIPSFGGCEGGPPTCPRGWVACCIDKEWRCVMEGTCPE